MKKRNEPVLPHARQEGLVVQEIPDEVLVYDLERHEAHCLNPTAARVWKYCDGRTSVPDIAHRLQHELNTPVDETVVWYALERLDKSNLLQARVARSAGAAKVSRRDVLGKLGIGTVLAIPLITSIVAPTAAQNCSPCCIPETSCAGNPCSPCHSTGSTDCTKRCRAKDNNCVGLSASGCPS